MSEFETYVAECMSQKSITPETLARYTGITPTTLREYGLSLREPKLRTFRRLAHVLGVPVYELVKKWEE